MKNQIKQQQKQFSTLFQTTITLIGLTIMTMITLPYADVSASEITERKNLLILGDSLSAGYGISLGQNWTDLFQKKLDAANKNTQVINASISGDTTANGLNRLPQALDEFKPEFILIELGANDGLRGLSPSHIKNNLESIIQFSLNAKAKVILMEIIIPPNYGKKYTQAFNQTYHELAREYSLSLIPFFLKNIAIDPELMQTDGLHPNEKAQIKITENIWNSLEPLL